MTQATSLQIELACLTRSCDKAVAHLRNRGLTVSASQCKMTIARLIAAGRRVRMPNPIKGGFKEATSIKAFDAEMGSRRLLERHLQAGHWITDPRRFAEACHEAGIAA